jgi:hypothetical protein
MLQTPGADQQQGQNRKKGSKNKRIEKKRRSSTIEKGSRDAGDVLRSARTMHVTFFLADGVVSLYLRSLGSDWRDGGGAPPPVEDDGLDAVPLVSAAVAAAATDTVDDG